MSTMILVFKKNNALIRTAYGDMTLGEALDVMTKKRRRSLYSVCVPANVEHSEAYRIRDGHSNSLKAFLRLANELGYEIQLEDTHAS